MCRKHLLPTPILNFALLLASLPFALASAQPQNFQPAQTPTPVRRYHAAPVEALFPRQTSSGCISGTYSCSDQGSVFSGICCANGQLCALDAQNSPACCPSGNVCTGTAPSSYRPPSTTSASFVANPYFSFPYIVTSFSNAGACSRAVSQCSVNYAACTAALEGVTGGGGVTVVVGGSTTIGGGAAAVTYPTSTATSVCSSLSSVACFGIQGSVCTAGSTGVFSVGTANAAARPTGVPCVGVVAGVAAGIGFGIMGI
ncbi:unnamed protein product [Discula destructiva]